MFTSPSQSWDPMWPEPVRALHVQPQFCKFIYAPVPLCLEDTVFLAAPIICGSYKLCSFSFIWTFGPHLRAGVG